MFICIYFYFYQPILVPFRAVKHQCVFSAIVETLPKFLFDIFFFYFRALNFKVIKSLLEHIFESFVVTIIIMFIHCCIVFHNDEHVTRWIFWRMCERILMHLQETSGAQGLNICWKCMAKSVCLYF